MSTVLTPPLGVPVTDAPENDVARTVSVPAQRENAPLESNPISGPITAVPPGMPPLDLCSCGHAAEAHEHYRSGDDCGACGAEVCGHYRPAEVAAEKKGVLGRLFGR